MPLLSRLTQKTRFIGAILNVIFGDTLDRANYFYGVQNYRRALKLYLKLPSNETAIVSFRIGMCYYHLDDSIKAEEFWIKAVEKGSSPAAHNLGLHYLRKSQIAKAKTNFERGASAGRADSMYQLALIAKQHGTETQMNHWLAKAAEKGYGPALYDIAEGMYKKNDFSRALELAQRARDLNVKNANVLVYRIQSAIKANSDSQTRASSSSSSSNGTRENIYGFSQGANYQGSSQSTYRQPRPKPNPKFTVMTEAEEAAAVWMRYMGFNAKVGGNVNAADKGVDIWSDAAVAQVKMHGKPVGSQMLHTFDSQANLHARNRMKLYFSWNGFNTGAIEVADQLGIYLFHMYSHGDLKPVNKLAKDLWVKAG